MKKKVVLVCETMGWAFENIGRQIKRHFGDRYDIQVIGREDSAGKIECDVVFYFWWKSALRGLPHITAKRTCIGMYDHWSIPQAPHQFAAAVDIADCFFVGNEAIRDKIKLYAPGKQVELTEDGVDLELFTPQPYPEEFTVGWTGNRVYKQIDLGDLKGVDLIEEACNKAGVKLLLQDKQEVQIPQAEMAEKFYRNISCYCCASLCEGTPCPACEALACGKTLVSTRVGIVPKIAQKAGRSVIIVDRTLKGIAKGIHEMKIRGDCSTEATQAVLDWDWKKKVMAFGPVLEGLK